MSFKIQTQVINRMLNRVKIYIDFHEKSKNKQYG